ncbi:MAG: autotransporter domain-containing protein [Pseudolabrys sp.]|nr:autotransporter domain-containing protein [Pseudolabrys sp.]
MLGSLVRHLGVAKRKSFASRINSVFGLAGLALSTLSVLSTTIIPAHAISINDATAANAGGIGSYFDQGNVYPFVASTLTMQPDRNNPNIDIPTSHCTGTLINARTILTAAHCFYDSQTNVFDGGPTTANPANQIQTVSFKPQATAGDTAGNDRTVTSIVIHKQYNNAGEGNDIALITLSAPVTTINPVKLATPSTPIAVNGQTIIMVGYGENGTGSTCCTPSDNKRRVAYGELGGLMARNTAPLLPASTLAQRFYFAQFRDPLNPNRHNAFNVKTPINALEGGTGRGDSGGPLFTYINGELIQLGELRGGDNPGGTPSRYGDIGFWTPVADYADWLAANNPLRSLTAKAGNYNWSNASAWQDGAPGGRIAAPTNFVGNVVNYETDLAYYYNVALSNPGNIMLDINPTVDKVAISGAQSQLTIPTGRVLTTEIDTTVSNGTALLTGGTLASPKVTLTGGMLAGAGTVAGLAGGNTAFLNNGGIVAPLGMLSVTGNFTQTAGTLQTRVDANGNSDLLTVSGTATLGGTYKAIVQAGLYGNTTTYGQVLAAGTRSGTFSSAVSSSPFFNASMTYTVNNRAFVGLNRIGFGAVAGLNANQQAVGNALERGYSTGVTGNAATLYANLLAAQSTNVLTQVSGASSGVSQTVALTGGSMFMSSMMDQAAAWRDGDNTSAPSSAPLGYAAEPSKKKGTDAFAALEPRRRAAPVRVWQAYGSGFGGWQSLDADANGIGSSQHVGGGAIGFNYQASPDLLVGFSAGVGTSNFSSGNSSGDATTGQIGIYGIRTFNALYVAGAVNYGFCKTNTSRLITGVGPTETAKGSFDSDQLGGRIEVGHRYVVNGYGITPFAAIQASTVWQDGYSENSVTSTGAPGVFGLNYGSQTTTSLPTFLGVQVDNRVAIGSALWTPSLRASWVHEFRPETQVSAAFNAIPGSGFTVEGPRAAENALRLELGSTVAFTTGLSLFGKVTAEVSDRSQSFTGNGGVKVAW